MQNLSTVPPMAELLAPPAWRTVDFISDLHLNANEPATFDAWQHYLRTTPADAVFMLGDLFEVWVGDDILGGDALAAGGKAMAPGGNTAMGDDAVTPDSTAIRSSAATDDSGAATPGDVVTPGGAATPGSASFENRCVLALRQAADRLDLFFMHGNRDFLIGQRFMAHCRATLLADPTVLTFAGQRWLLSHGDALCLDDVDYLKFRQQVRSPAWQSAFLNKPLAERQALARHMRAQSQLHQQGGKESGRENGKEGGQHYADVDNAAARQWLQAASAHTLIHGHTHKPGAHDLSDGLQRIVLSDWDAQARPPRADALRLTASAGLQRIALPGALKTPALLPKT